MHGRDVGAGGTSLELQLKTVRLLLGQHRQSKLVLFRLEV